MLWSAIGKTSKGDEFIHAGCIRRTREETVSAYIETQCYGLTRDAKKANLHVEVRLNRVRFARVLVEEAKP